jgi:hypothetical protein
MTTVPSVPTVTYTLREVVDRIEDKVDKVDERVEHLELKAASQVAVRWSVVLSLVSGPGAALLTYVLTRR